MRTSLCIAAALLLAAVLALTGLGGTARAWAVGSSGPISMEAAAAFWFASASSSDRRGKSPSARVFS